MPEMIEKFSLTIQDAEKLFKEKVDSLRKEAGYYQNQVSALQVKIDEQRKESVSLEKDLESKRAQVTEVEEKTQQMEAGLEQMRVNITKTLEDKERKAQVLIDQSDAKSKKAAADAQAAGQAKNQLNVLCAEFEKQMETALGNLLNVVAEAKKSISEIKDI